MLNKQKAFFSLLPKQIKDSLKWQDKDDIQKAIISGLIRLDIDDSILSADIKKFYDVSSGRLFEYYVESIIDKEYWKVVSWRGDKFQKLYCKRTEEQDRPESNSCPDIIIEYKCDKSLQGFKKGDRVAMECKWTNHTENTSLEECAENRLKHYRDNPYYLKKALNDNASCFYYAIGVGHKIIRNLLKPEALYLIPASEIKTNDLSKFKVKRQLRFNKNKSLISKFLESSVIEEFIKESSTRLDRLAVDFKLHK